MKIDNNELWKAWETILKNLNPDVSLDNEVWLVTAAVELVTGD